MNPIVKRSAALASLVLGVASLITACSSAAQSDSATLAEQGRRGAPAPTVTATAPTLPHPGRLLASNCFQCHGTDGKGPGFDRLAGESVSELVGEMKELQTETEADEAIMAVHAQSYTDAQIRLIAEYFAQVK